MTGSPVASFARCAQEETMGKDQAAKTTKVNPAPPDTVGAEKRVLERINGELAKFELAPLRKLGVKEDGWEILALAGFGHVNTYYAVVHFKVRQPSGRTGDYFMQCPRGEAQGHGCIVLAVLNGTHVAIVRQHRATMLFRSDEDGGDWTNEFPRAWVGANQQPTMVDRKLLGPDREGSLSFRGAARELLNILMDRKVEIQGNKLLDRTPENTGVNTNLVDIIRLDLKREHPDELIGQAFGPRAMRMRFVAIDALRTSSGRKEVGINDLHSLAALHLLLEPD